MRRSAIALFIGFAVILIIAPFAEAQSLNIPSKTWGLSFGNSKEFSGLRFNFRDSRVRRIRGVNVTLWQPRKDNKDSLIEGISLGLIPGGGNLRGLQIGILGVGAERDIKGISLGLLGAGAGEDIVGVSIGGLGAGAGKDLKGIALGGLGAGAGEDVVGLVIGGLGAGAGKNLKGIIFGGLGAGAGEDVVGITIGGLGAGAGKNMIGLNVGGLGVGAGERLAGISIGGIGAGAGKELKGIALAGIGAGAPAVRGLLIGGAAVGGQDIKGIFLAGGCVHVPKGGQMSGLAASAFNYIKGSQTGLCIGIVNYAYSVKGVQIGIVNIVRENPKSLRILPIFNTSF